MIAPDRPAQGNALRRRGAGRPDLARTGGSAAPIQPAIGSEMQAIGKIVIILGRDAETVQDDFRRAVGHIIAITVWNKNKAARAHQPHSAKSHFQAGEMGGVTCELTSS